MGFAIECFRLLIQVEAVSMRGASRGRSWANVVCDEWLSGLKLVVFDLEPGLDPMQDRA